MKLMTMVLAAALIPAAAVAGPNGQDQQTQGSSMNQRGNTGGTSQNSNATGASSATPQETVEVEAFEWSTGQGRLGLILMGLTPQLRSYFGAPNNSGLLVGEVAPNSPAARAGVRVGDVITQVDQQSVQSGADIAAATQKGPSANKVQIHVIRNHKGLNLQASLGNNPSETNQSGMNRQGQSPDQNTGT